MKKLSAKSALLLTGLVALAFARPAAAQNSNLLPSKRSVLVYRRTTDIPRRRLPHQRGHRSRNVTHRLARQPRRPASCASCQGVPAGPRRRRIGVCSASPNMAITTSSPGYGKPAMYRATACWFPNGWSIARKRAKPAMLRAIISPNSTGDRKPGDGASSPGLHQINSPRSL